MDGITPMEQLYEDWLRVLRCRVERGLLELYQVAEVLHSFEKEIGKKKLHQSRAHHNQLFNKMSNACARPDLQPFVDYENKVPDKE